MNSQYWHQNVIVSATQSTTAMKTGLDVTQKTAKESGFITSVLMSNGLQKDPGIAHPAKN